MQITLHLEWTDDGRPEGFAVTTDSPGRPFSGRLELLAALEELCAPQPTPTRES